MVVKDSDSNILNVTRATKLEHIDSLNIVYETIDSLDEKGILELFGGYDKDIDIVTEVLLQEAIRVISYPDADRIGLGLDGIDKLTDVFEETLRRSIFSYFIMTVLPRFELAPHILEWTMMVQIYRLLAIMAARGHAKSHTFSYAYTLWKMFRYSPKRGQNTLDFRSSKEGMIITNEYSLSKKFLGEIRSEIEQNDYLREKLYPQNRDGWGSESLTASNGAILHAKSYGSKLRGYHPTYIILDDYLNESVLYSADQNDKYIRFFNAVIMNMLMKYGQGIVVGTPFLENDLYGVLKASPDWNVFEYPALMPDGTILWESEHTAQSLLSLRKRIGTVNFSREIMVKPISDMSAVLPYHIVSKAFNNKLTLVESKDLHPYAKLIVNVVTGIDYAFSSATGADFVRIYTIGVLSDGRRVLMNVTGGHGIKYSTQIEMAKSVNRRFTPDLFVSENNQGQAVMSDMLADEGMPVLRHQTGTDKYSLYEGIPAISIVFENDIMELPTGDEKSREASERLARQLSSFVYNKEKGKLAFTMEHDDDAMAFWQTLRGVNYVTKHRFSF